MMRLKNIVITAIIVVLIVTTAYAGYRLAFRNLIFPRVSVAGIDVGGMDRMSALKLVTSYFVATPTNVILETKGTEVAKLSGLSVEHDLVWAVDQALGVGRNGNILTQITEQTRSLFEGRSIEVPISYDQDELKNIVDQMVDNLNQKPVLPKLVRKNGEVELVAGINGVEVKTDTLTQKIVTDLALPGEHRVEVPLTVVDTKENTELVNQAKMALSKWGDRRLRLKFRDFEKTLDQGQMLSIWGLTSEVIDNEHFNALVEGIKPEVETEPKDAVFVFEDNKVNEFKPEVVGATIDIPAFKKKLVESLLSAEDKPLEIPVILTYPKIKAGDI